MRISIIGQAGGGKSTLANNISKKLNIPYLQIDRLWVEAKGHKLKQNDSEGLEKVRSYIKEKVENFIKQDDWVSDGWYPRVQTIISERADVILFLDISFLRRLWNHFKRAFISKDKKRYKEYTKLGDIKFIYQMIRRTIIKGPALRWFVKNNSNKTKVFKNYKEIDEYLKSLN